MDSELLVFVFVTVSFTFAWNGFSAFFPLFLAEEKELSDSTASISYSLLFIASFSQTVTGDLSDRIGQLQVGSSLFIIILGGILSLIVVDNSR